MRELGCSMHMPENSKIVHYNCMELVEETDLYGCVRMVEVGTVEEQRWNGCPTGDGRVEVCFVD